MAVVTVFGELLGMPLLLALGSIFNGYALKVLWKWFIVPIFHLPQLTIPSAIGIALIISYLTEKTNNCTKKKMSSRGEAIVYSIFLALFKPFTALFVGWIVQKFM